MNVAAPRPLGAHERALLAELATLIAGGGAWRFLFAPVVAADARSYPGAWDESRAAIARVIGRTLWHAHLPVEAEVHDVRKPAMRSFKLLRETKVALTRVDRRSVALEISALGNDDVAGIVSHEVGRAFVGWLRHDDGAPFRAASHRELPSPGSGAIAAVYLGLGVIAANAAYFDRSAGDQRDRAAHAERARRRDGIDVADVAFLLAVQATVRGAVPPAFSTLRPTPGDYVARWRRDLGPRAAELRRLLGLDAPGALHPPPRPAAPPPITVHGAIAEHDLYKHNLGQPVFRYTEDNNATATVFGTVAGAVMGAAAVAVAPVHGFATVVGVVAMAAGAGLGVWKRRLLCASCGGAVSKSDTACERCGGRIVGDLARLEDREAKEAEYAAACAAQQRAGGERGARS
ncbi:MAG TPA: hypothetical protein VFP84_28425 [Kofleriaceae bacterium]|nr:hypothetical protein [Kofleriaceae bacterium]